MNKIVDQIQLKKESAGRKINPDSHSQSGNIFESPEKF